MIRKGVVGGSFKPLTQDSIYKIHQTAMRVIEEVGFEVNSETALELFKKDGAWVDQEKRRVRLLQRRILELIEKAPSEVRLCGQDEGRDVLLGGQRVYTGTGGTALYAKLVDQLDNIHLFMLPTYPNELPIEQVDINRFFAGVDNTTKHVMGGVYTLDGVKQTIRMAEIIAGSSEKLRQRPLISMIACSVSPMMIDSQYGDLVVSIAESGIPLVCPAEPLCGATSPVTLAGNLVIQTVDSLIGVLLAQIVNPGTPVIFGSVAASADLSDFKYLSGSVEMGLLNAAGAQMAQFYKLPFYGTGGMTDSKVLDAQSGYESAITGLLCALAGANFIHDAAGLMEFALTVCYEKYVIDNEILGMVLRAVEGIEVNDDTLAFDLIKQVGPSGNFSTAKHTRRFMRSEHYQPSLSDRDNREQWEAKGRRTTWRRAAERVEELIATHGWSLPVDTRKQVLSEIAGIID
jgi:trimethylamine--corrinoid protein Co-methyltransferase